MKWLLAVVGLGVGLLVVRSFFLGPLEEIAFRAFWELVKHVDLSAKTWRQIADTAIAQKFLVGGGVGLAAGFALGSVAGGRKR